MANAKYNIGDAVIGIRGADMRAGILVERYYTINGFFKNTAYRIRLQNGKVISYQFIKHSMTFEEAMRQMRIGSQRDESKTGGQSCR